MIEHNDDDDGAREQLEESLAYTAKVLFHERGGLSDCLQLCDKILDEPSFAPPRNEAQCLALCYRAIILIFLACDSLALQDLQRLKLEHKEEYAKMGFLFDCPQSFVCSASEWHRARRFAMLRRCPQLKQMYNTKQTVNQTIALLFALVCVHFTSITLVAEHAILCLPLALISGAVCAFGFQALTHELSHMVFSNTNTLAFALSTLACSFCNFHWHYYYFNYHNRHHAHTGGEKDRDGDILFRAWHAPPTISRSWMFFNMGSTKLTRWAWTAVFAFSIYFMFCRAKFRLDAPHEPTLKYEGPMVAMHCFVLVYFGWAAYAYLLLSAAFSLGAFGHPFIQFWLTQHAFVAKREVTNPELLEHARRFAVPLLQPTVSGRTSSSSWWSSLWQAVNFGELRHVEHHDFPVVSFWYAHHIPRMSPEFYSELQTATYRDDFSTWLYSDKQKQYEWMSTRGDFAGRGYYLTKLWRIMMEEEEQVEEEIKRLEEDLDAQPQLEEKGEVEVEIWREEDDVDAMSESGLF